MSLDRSTKELEKTPEELDVKIPVFEGVNIADFRNLDRSTKDLDIKIPAPDDVHSVDFRKLAKDLQSKRRRGIELTDEELSFLAKYEGVVKST